MPTSRDVAREARVSAATVSHVLNGTRNVLPETARRVLDAIAKTGYVHNSVARTMRTGRTKTVGLIGSTVSNPYFVGTQQALDDAVADLGYSLISMDHRDKGADERRALELMLGWQLSAIIMQPALDEGPALDWLLERRVAVPVVLIDRNAPGDLKGKFDFAGTENIEAAARLVGHLIEHGHRKVGLVCGDPASSTMSEREVGYRLALKRAGIVFDERLVRFVAADVEAAAAAARELLSTVHPVTAIFAANDQTSVGTLIGVRRHGLRVPDDIAVVAFDDLPWAEAVHPSLTCARQRSREIADAAARLALQRVSSGTTRIAPVQRIIDTVFMRRESCGCRR